MLIIIKPLIEQEEKEKALKKLTKRHNRILKQNLTDLAARCNLEQGDVIEENNKLWEEKLQTAGLAANDL